MAIHLQDSTTAAPIGIGVIAPHATLERNWPALAAAIVGGLMIFGVGFANLSVAHNAAHDTRHMLVFPCH